MTELIEHAVKVPSVIHTFDDITAPQLLRAQCRDLGQPCVLDRYEVTWNDLLHLHLQSTAWVLLHTQAQLLRLILISTWQPLYHNKFELLAPIVHCG